ncbi:hypothetical protein NL676_002425 [Syzygium grande]|nr:hypothetical protein NL676_002425 [Syzygium grande]
MRVYNSDTARDTRVDGDLGHSSMNTAHKHANCQPDQIAGKTEVKLERSFCPVNAINVHDRVRSPMHVKVQDGKSNGSRHLWWGTERDGVPPTPCDAHALPKGASGSIAGVGVETGGR